MAVRNEQWEIDLFEIEKNRRMLVQVENYFSILVIKNNNFRQL